MRSSRTSRIRAAALAGIPVAAIVLATLAPPAQSHVEETAGAAFGAQVDLLGGTVLGPLPDVAESSGGAGSFDYSVSDNVLAIQIPDGADCPEVPPLAANVAQVCAVDATVTGEDDADPHLRSVSSAVEVANVVVGGVNLNPLADGVPSAPILTLEAVTADCRADGDDVTSSVSILGASGISLGLGDIAPNTGVDIDGIATVLLHEVVSQVETEPNGGDGENSIVVNAARISVPLLGLNLVVGHVECSAIGPNVNLTTTTTTTVPDATTTTTTTVPDATTTTTTTVPDATTTTVPPSTSTVPPTTVPSGTVPPSTTSTSTTSTTVLPPDTTVAPPDTTVPPTVPPPVARTGSSTMPLVAMGALAIALGTIVRSSERRFSTATASAPAPTVPAGPPEFRPVSLRPSAARRRGRRRSPLDAAASDAMSAFDGGTGEGDSGDGQQGGSEPRVDG